MLANIVSKIHFLIIIYSLWTGWEMWEEYKLNSGDLIAQKPILMGRIKKLKRDEKRVKNYLKDIEKAKERIKVVEKEVSVLQRKLPEKIQDSTSINIIKSIGQSLNIKNIFLAPSVEENKGFYFAKSYDLTATGTYLQFLLLFEKLAGTEQLFNVRTIQLKKSIVKRRGRYQLLNAKVSIESYRYNPNHKNDTDVDESK